MDKQIFNTRQRLASTEQNQIMSDTETYGQEVITKLNYGLNTVSSTLFGYDSIVFGLLGTAVGAASFNSVNYTFGLAYHENGKKIWVPNSGVVPTGFQAVWDGVYGQLAPPVLDRIDVLSISHRYSSTTGVKYYIDSNPASITYGEIISASNIIAQTDYYTVLITTGTPNVAPAIPAIPAGYIPLSYIYISSIANNGGHPIYIEPSPVTHAHAGAWDPAETSDVDNRIYTSGLRNFRNGSFFSSGTTDGAGAINPTMLPYSMIYDYNIIVNSAANTWLKITSADFNAGTQVLTCSTGHNGVTYILTARGE